MFVKMVSEVVFEFIVFVLKTDVVMVVVYAVTAFPVILVVDLISVMFICEKVAVGVFIMSVTPVVILVILVLVVL